MFLERTVDFHLVVTYLSFKPRSCHLAYAVMVAHGGAVFLNIVHDTLLILEVLVKLAHLRLKDEIEVRALGIEMRHMSHAYGVGSALAEAADILIDGVEIVPVDRAFKRVKHKPVVAHILAEIRVCEAAVLPTLCDKARCVHSAVPLADFVYLLGNILAEVLFTLTPAEHENPFSVLIALGGEELVDNSVRNAVETERDGGLLGVGETEY